MFAVRGTVPRNKEKRAVRKDKTDRRFLEIRLTQDQKCDIVKLIPMHY